MGLRGREVFESGWFAPVSYVLLAVAALFPRSILLHHYPSSGLPEEDMGQSFWNFWWTLRQLSSFESIYSTDLIFHPHGADLSFHMLHLFNSLFVLPFQALGVPAVGVNLFMVLASALSGWGVFLLCRQCGLWRRPARVAGALFLLCPYRFGQLMHFNAFNTFPILFYLLWMRKGLESERVVHRFLWALWLLIAANTALYYLVFLLILSPLWWIYLVREAGFKRYRGLYLRRTAIAALLFLLLFAPQLSVYLGAEGQQKYQRPLPVAVYWSADLMNFLLPPAIGSQIQEVSPVRFYSLDGQGEFAVYPGTLLYVLLIAGLIVRRKFRGRFWLWIGIMGAVLALGPVLKVFKPVYFAPGETALAVPMPALLLRYIPFLGSLRVWARWSLLWQMGLILFVACNYRGIEIWLRRKLRLGPVVIAALVVIISFVENWPGPLSHSDETPPRALRTLSLESPGEAVLHLPYGEAQLGGYYMYLQTISRLPIMNGYLSFETRPDRVLSHPVVLLFDGRPGSVSLESVLEDIRKIDLGWIIIHRERFRSKDRYVWTRRMVVEALQGRLFAEEGGMEIYRIQHR